MEKPIYLITAKGPILWNQEKHNKLLAENNEEGLTITNENKHEIYETLRKFKDNTY